MTDLMMQQRLMHLATPEVSDALDACGLCAALPNIKPLMPGSKLVGVAYTIRYEAYPKKPMVFQGAANYIEAIPPGVVVVIDNEGRLDCTTWGGILTHQAAQQGIAGTIVYGAVRDVASIIQQRYPVFSTGVSMCSGKNRVRIAAMQETLTIHQVRITPGDMIFGDEHGVLVIPKNALDDIVSKAEKVKESEEKIIKAITAGMSLTEARALYRYDKPWSLS